MQKPIEEMQELYNNREIENKEGISNVYTGQYAGLY